MIDGIYQHDTAAEKCRECTLKHLSTALVYLNDIETPEPLRNAYIMGNLAHAANHFIQYDLALSNELRALRIDSIDDSLHLLKPILEIKDALESLIIRIADWQASSPSVPVVAATTRHVTPKTEQPPQRRSGCRCGKR